MSANPSDHRHRDAADGQVVAIVHLGRAQGMGGIRRVHSLRSLFELTGATVHEIRLTLDHRSSLRDVRWSRTKDLMIGAIVPEALAWSASSSLDALRELEPDLVICETARAFDVSFTAGPWNLVLDYVDRLSVSYRDRSSIRGPYLSRFCFGALSRPAARFERRDLPVGVRGIAAGWADAEALGAEWVPNNYDVPDDPVRRPTHDLLFFGNLSYPPNVEAVDRLAGLWPVLRARRPTTTLLVAGARPLPHIRRLALDLGWTLSADFPDLEQLVGSARLGIVTLIHASGIQGKVVEAAALGLPQVVDPVAIAGMRPGFPVAIARNDDEFVSKTLQLLENDDELAALGTAARLHVRATYSASASLPWAVRQLLPPDEDHRPPRPSTERMVRPMMRRSRVIDWWRR